MKVGIGRDSSSSGKRDSSLLNDHLVSPWTEMEVHIDMGHRHEQED